MSTHFAALRVRQDLNRAKIPTHLLTLLQIESICSFHLKVDGHPDWGHKQWRSSGPAHKNVLPFHGFWRLIQKRGCPVPSSGSATGKDACSGRGILDDGQWDVNCWMHPHIPHLASLGPTSPTTSP